MKTKGTFFFFIILIAGFSARAADYYVSPSGNDANDGHSPATPWRTLGKISSTTFLPGDRILLKAGGVWSGQMAPGGSGMPGNPIVVDCYGGGRKPVINAPGTDTSAAFSLKNQSWWEIRYLELTNRQCPGGLSKLWGVLVTATDTTHGLTHIYIKDCYIHDVGSLSDEAATNFNKGTGGILFVGYTNDILVKGCHIANVSVEGIRNSSEKMCSHIVIDSNLLENIYGDGIVLHGVKDGSAILHNIGRNLCYNTSRANYAGMWTFLSRGTVVAYNEISGITGGGIYDGEPFDADIATDGDIFEYNYTHDNKRGFMLFMPNARNIIVRFNVSVNDAGDGRRLFNYTGKKTGSGNRIYNNVFYIPNDIHLVFQNTTKAAAGFPGDFSNNILYCKGRLYAFSQAAISVSGEVHSNCFYPQSFTRVNGPAKNVSGNIYGDPLFTDPGFHSSGMLNGVRSAYRLSAGSPCAETGTDIPDNGDLDFAGANITDRKPASIGAVWGKIRRE